MALHLSWSPTSLITSSDSTRSSVPRRMETNYTYSTSNLTTCNNTCVVLFESNYSKVIRESVRVKCASVETTSVETEELVGKVTKVEIEELVGKVTEVNKDTFWPIVNSAQHKIVVLDMFTQWCGPCKVMAPKFETLAQEKLDVIFLKLDCNQENKALAKELGIRVVPTFKIMKDSKIVKEVTGAKFDELKDAINKCCEETS